MVSRIEEIKGRIAAVNTGSWVRSEQYVGDGYSIYGKSSLPIAQQVWEVEDAELIVNAKDDIEYLISRLELAKNALTHLAENSEKSLTLTSVEEYCKETLKVIG